MDAPNYAAGYIHGTGADQNVSLGWIPEYVRIVNLTDGDKVWENGLAKVIAFTSGGTTEIKAGDEIRGLTNTGVYGRIRQVILDSGSWAGGDAAGWFIFEPDGITGSFGSETAEVNDNATDSVTVALQDNDGIDVDTEVAGTTTDDTNISHYAGTSTAAKGFKIGATVSENGKLLYYQAWRTDHPIDQTTLW